MKQRLTSLDLLCLSSELLPTLSAPGACFRLTNIYTLTPRLFLLKFSLPNRRHLLLLDSGFRAHLTSFTRDTEPAPSAFVAKLRKHLRSRRLTKIGQVGTDRVLRLEFSDGEWRLYVEFFAGGNVVLVDREGIVRACLRIVELEGDGTVKVGVPYVLAKKEAEEREGEVEPVTKERVVGVLTEASAVGEPEEPAEEGKKGKKKQQKKKKGGDAIKRVLGLKMSEFGPLLVEHCLLNADVNPGLKADDVLKDSALVDKVVEAMKEAEKVIEEIKQRKEGDWKGYIIARRPKSHQKAAETGAKKEEKKKVGFGGSDGTEAVEKTEDEVVEKVQEEGEAKGWVFEDFCPFLPKQFIDVPDVKVFEYDGFNKAVDTFFSSIEAQKLESRLEERKATAEARLAHARTEHDRRVSALRDVQDLNVRKAEAIETNTTVVEEATAAVNALLAQGMDWVAMARLIEVEQQRGNPVAERIQLPLKIFENKITLKLYEADWDAGLDSDSEADETESESESDSDDDDEENPKSRSKESKHGPKPLLIDIDLSLTPYANARIYYSQKRSAAEKESKTIASSTRALKSTEAKITADLQKHLKTEKTVLRPVRKPLWFEKFLFFISSDGYLVLAGRDAQQNELLYRKHFRKGDVYVHADVHGAATVIVKNNPSTPGAPIPPGTLQQAGQLSVCCSQAWDQKAVLSAWWVGFEQVSKTAPTGEYLTTGGFMIRGKKNYLPPAQLLLGFGVLWKVDEESAKRRGKHRLQEEKEEEEEKRIESELAKDGSAPEVATDLGSVTETKEEEEHPQSEEEDSDDEEFPDTKLESDEDSDDEFPDTKLESEDEKAGNEPSQQPTEEEPQAEMATDKYGLPIAPTTTTTKPLDPSTSEPTPSKPQSAKPRLSAKQRRDLKKGKDITGSTPASHDTTRTGSPAPSTATNTTSSKPLPRGKRTKLKRAAQKYQLQDESDRALANELLGISLNKDSSQSQDQPESEEPKETPEQRKARLRAQHQAATAKSEALRHAEGSDDEEDSEIINTPLDSLVPDPRAEDTILDAIPVCAPWTAMGRFKYRVKLQPGAQKKGKALREVWTAWTREGKNAGKGKDGAVMEERERELVKAWKEGDVVNCVGVGKLKVMSGPGGGTGGGGEKGKGGGGGGRGGKGGKRGGKGSKK